jgi:hypothetical protein
MASGDLSIKLRCASWPQLATIYKRDLSQGTMFLRASTPPAIGTVVRIDLALPSATVIALSGVVQSHVNDPQRGAGVELKLAPIPTGSVWLIESALAAEHKRLATPVHGTPIVGDKALAGASPGIGDRADVSAAEHELIKALMSEAESLKKLNPFLVLGVGYEATDGEVRAAFGELTKRYHPDRFARYESDELRQVAAEIFILIRDAYRRLGDAMARAQVLHSLGKPANAPRAVPGPRRTPPTVPPPKATQRVPVVPGASPPPPPSVASVSTSSGASSITSPGASPRGAPSPSPSAAVPIPPPPRMSVATAPTAQLPVVRSSSPSLPAAARSVDARQQRTSGRPTGEPAATPAAGAATVKRAVTDPGSPQARAIAPPLARDPSAALGPRTGQSQAMPVIAGDAPDVTALEALLDQGKLDEALASYRTMGKKHPHDRNLRAGVELCEGLRALAARDRLEAAQRFEAALEIDPSNERAARELADMRRQATNERKGLLSRLMGKKEP